jgi:hypothetical protein
MWNEKTNTYLEGEAEKSIKLEEKGREGREVEEEGV